MPFRFRRRRRSFRRRHARLVLWGKWLFGAAVVLGIRGGLDGFEGTHRHLRNHPKRPPMKRKLAVALEVPAVVAKKPPPGSGRTKRRLR